MVGINLTINQFVFCSIFLNKINKSGFGGIGNFGKHTFATKYSSLIDAIKSAYQFSVLPNFYAFRDTGLVESDVGLFHFIGDPGSFLSGTLNSSAIFNYSLK